MIRKMHVLRLLIITSSIAVGCSGGVTQPSQRPIGQPFELRAGASAMVEGGLTLTFDRVTTDSRCPMNALCVWSGNAIVAVSLSQGAGGPAARELHTEASRSEVSYLAYAIRLVSLAPYPRTDREIRPGDYVATLAVTAR
jgi:hypothetical protein